MKIFCLFSITFCMLFSNTCLSQNNEFLPGFYINQKGDTIKGYSAIKNGYALSVFKFKTGLQNNATDIAFDSCKLLSSGAESFVNWFGTRSMTYIDKTDFHIVNVDSSITNRIPLQLIYKGNRLSLYHYHDVTDHFFWTKQIHSGNCQLRTGILRSGKSRLLS